MFKKTLLATSLAFAMSGCSITPEVISPNDIASTAKADIELLSKHQAIEGVVTLEEALARAVLNNRDKKLKLLETALAHGEFELAQHEMLPSLTASAGYSERDNYAGSASVNFSDGQPDSLGANPAYSVSQEKEHDTQSVAFTWNILDFGLSYVRANQYADRYLISKERERKVVHNITQDVRASYWRAVSAERLLTKINPLIKQTAEALKNSREIETKKLRSPLEALYYQRELLDILRALQSLRQDLMGAKTELASLIGLKPGTLFELADVSSPKYPVPELHVELEQMEELALQQRPELIETHYQKRISAAETKAAMLDLLPGINLTAGVYKDSNEYMLNQDWTSMGAQVSWNLFDVFTIGAKNRMAETREALVGQQRLAASMAVLTQVHLARIRYEQAGKSFDLASKYLDVAQRISEQTQNSARMKRASNLDLIRESLNTLLAELRRDVAYADLQNSYGRIYVTMGVDLLPTNYTEVSLQDLSEQIGDRLDQWQKGELTPIAAGKDEASVLVAGEKGSTENGVETALQPVLNQSEDNTDVSSGGVSETANNNTADSDSSAPVTPVSVKLNTVKLGPFNPEQAELASQKLEDAGITFRSEQNEHIRKIGYILLNNKVESNPQAIASDLSGHGLKNVEYINYGAYKGRVSFGVSYSEAEARKRLQQVEKYGYQVELVTRYRKQALVVLYADVLEQDTQLQAMNLSK